MKHKNWFLSLLIVMVMILTVIIPMDVSAVGNTEEFAGGTGTATDPYLISTKTHLDNVRFYPSAHFKMIADVEFTDADFAAGGSYYNNGLGWEPIGYTSDSFTGVFNGNYHTIKNLYIKNSNECIGLFGTVSGSGASIKNLYLIDADVSGGKNTGGIAGYIDGASILNCYVDGIITGSGENVGAIGGGFFGSAYISSCVSSGTVKGTDNVGGICGFINPYVNSQVETYATVTKCYNKATVSGSGCVGGIIGKFYSTYAHKTQWVQGTYGGASYDKVVSYYHKEVNVSNCYNVGTISATANSAAGIVGCAAWQSGPYSNSSSNTHQSSLQNCYNCGTVNGSGSYVRNVVGEYTMLSISGCYYLQGSGTGTTSSEATVKTHNQMRTQSSFSGWNFTSIWTMKGGEAYLYPELQCFVLTGSVSVDGIVAYGKTVKPDVSASGCALTDMQYEWLVDGTVVSTDVEYTIQPGDVGKSLSLKATSLNAMKAGTIYSASHTVEKGIRTDELVVPEVFLLEETLLALFTVDTQEYSLDNVNWTTDYVFENLEPGTIYTVYSRFIEDELYYAGESKAVLTVTTLKAPEGPKTDASFKFAGASLTLQHNIAVNFKADKALFTTGGFTDPYVVFEMNGARTTVKNYTVSGNRYVFAFKNIGPNRMNDTISATMYATKDGNLYASATRTYSVAEYCYSMLELYSADQYAELRTLLVDLLNYGAASQWYTGYNVDSLVNENLTAAQKQWGTAETPALESVLNTSYETVEDPKATWRGAGLQLNDAVSVRLTLRADNIENMKVVIKTDKQEWIINSDAFIDNNGTSYYVYFNGLHAGQMRETFYITVYEGNTAVSNTASYSIESYAQQKAEGDDFDLADLVIAMMKYGDSAYAYMN